LIQKEIYGIVGVLQFYSGPVMVAITERQFVGLIDGHHVYRLAGVSFVSLMRRGALRSLAPKLRKRENRTRRLVRDLLVAKGAKYFYFSYGYDLSHCLQRAAALEADSAASAAPLCERFDERFYWNRYAHAPLRQGNAPADYLLPLLRGCVQIYTFLLRNKPFELALVSRRSRHHAGTRYRTRGIGDGQGSVANYVETEQILLHRGTACSFVQTRGSVPLFWEQRPLKHKLNPKPNLLSSRTATEQLAGFCRHFEREVERHSTQVIVNLLDQRGDEQDLCDAFEQHVRLLASPFLTYVAFDFHYHCRNNNFDNVFDLLEQVSDVLDFLGFFKRNMARRSAADGGGSSNGDNATTRRKRLRTPSALAAISVERLEEEENVQGDGTIVGLLADRKEEAEEKEEGKEEKGEAKEGANEEEREEETHVVKLNTMSSPLSLSPISGSSECPATLELEPLRCDGVVMQQRGLVRTNCLDCLDRTNLVQSTFANRSLYMQLKSFGMRDLRDTEIAILERIFKEAWANNGDAVSHQYAGTGALKSDFTRTGKRTGKGMLRDGQNALNRHVINNFLDGLRQFGNDFFLGHASLVGIGSHSATHSSSSSSSASSASASSSSMATSPRPHGGDLSIFSDDDDDDDASAASASGALLGDDLDDLDDLDTGAELLKEELAHEQLLERCAAQVWDCASLDESDECILYAWRLISINKRQQHQQRVVLLTPQHWYRVKYNFVQHKFMHLKRLRLTDVTRITYGDVSSPKRSLGGLGRNQYGVQLHIDLSKAERKNEKALQTFVVWTPHRRTPPELASAIAMQIAEAVQSARHASMLAANPDHVSLGFFLNNAQINVAAATSVYGALHNRLKLGRMYGKKSKLRRLSGTKSPSTVDSDSDSSDEG
jgi:SacI homology domain/Inositol phosphatase